MNGQGNLKKCQSDRLRYLLYYRFHIEDKYPVDAIAQKMGVHQDTLYKWLNGTNSFPADELISLIKATDDISYLEFIANKCGYAIIPKAKNKQAAENLQLLSEILARAAKGVNE